MISHRPPTWNEMVEPRPAKVMTDLGEFFSPWPWCPYKDVPHDAHSVNEGNCTCAGVPGMLSGISVEDATELAAAAKQQRKDAYDRTVSARGRLQRASVALVRALEVQHAAEARDRETP